ncbi:transcriptional regulator [Parabacteroides sp. 52]|uniref:RNA-binding domain-containing protein n=1 Tax=unclassified Parabacteroides TaxID=2649774 RepID=UPI0013D50667|nr:MULTISPECIES: RNA-binding domain-containing protein [unclassified Parabacteroides]MDH6534574.1 ATP-dependent DNA helicase RecG [Parabacteroides sp. PM5-20]NDV55192.1 transcriptional regulator [Parabacteroides sp. 52]
MITQQEILQLLHDTESYRVERTTSKTNTDKFCQAICAFANDISGNGKNGYLMIGAHDNGELSGLKVDDELLLTVSNIRTDGNVLPQPVMTVEKFSFEKGDLLVAEVQPSEFPPVRYRGRIWVRVGPRKSFATEAEEKILMEKRLSNIHTFDEMPCIGTTMNDLDVDVIKREFLPQAVAEDILAEDKRPVEEQLASLGYYDLRYNCPTNGAIVLFGKNPERYLHGSYVQYVRFKGKDRAGDIINEQVFSGNLCKELARIDTFIETSISQKRPIPVSVLREETVSKYPYWATRELLMNAIMHRDYQTNAPVLFYEYDNRIEVQNPGGLYGKVSEENFPNVSDYRNPFIAKAMKILGYVNRFSRGIYRVQKELVENGNGEAIFDFDLITAFRATENVSQRYFEEGFGADTQENGQETPKKRPRNTQETPKNIQDEIIEAIKNNSSITRKELEALLDRTPDSIKYHLAQLTKKGIIKHVGSTKAGKWVVIE